jgi:disease resistance protein RPM1
LAFVKNNRATRIITTTHNHEVAGKAGEVYKIQSLSYANSRKLFFVRVFGDKNKSYEQQVDDEVFDKIVMKCGGIPLAIITMASLLVGKPCEEWLDVYHSIGFADK